MRTTSSESAATWDSTVRVDLTLIAVGTLLVVWLAANLSDPAPSAPYLLLLGVVMIGAGVSQVVRGRGRKR